MGKTISAHALDRDDGFNRGCGEDEPAIIRTQSKRVRAELRLDQQFLHRHWHGAILNKPSEWLEVSLPLLPAARHR